MQKWNLRSKKFIAFIATQVLGIILFAILVGFGLVDHIEKVFSFMTYSLGIYIGGNGLTHIAQAFKKSK